MIGKSQQTGSRAAQPPQDPLTSGDNRTVVLDRNILIKLRISRGWSQSKLASQAGVSEDTISRAENWKPVRLNIAETIASTYNVELAALMPAPAGERANAAQLSAIPLAPLFAIGPDIICAGSLTHVDAASWTICFNRFLIGDLHTLVTFINGFAEKAPESRYLLSSEVGDGRELIAPPSLTSNTDHFSLLCPIAPCSLRTNVREIGNSFASHPDTNDLYLDVRGNIARVSGLDYFPQRVREVLSMQLGESPFFPTSGVRLFEYFEAYRKTPWLNIFFKLEIIRQASIPQTNPPHTALQCVTRVYNVEVLSETPVKNRLPVHLEFEVQGLGRWQHDVAIYMPTAEQMTASRRMQAQHRHVLGNSLGPNS